MNSSIPLATLKCSHAKTSWTCAYFFFDIHYKYNQLEVLIRVLELFPPGKRLSLYEEDAMLCPCLLLSMLMNAIMIFFFVYKYLQKLKLNANLTSTIIQFLKSPHKSN